MPDKGFRHLSVFHIYENCYITFSLHEAIGWGLYLIFDEGKDPTQMSKSEFENYLKQGKEKACEEKDRYNRMLNKLTPVDYAEVERLQKKLGDKNLSNNQRGDIMTQIEQIFARYG